MSRTMGKEPLWPRVKPYFTVFDPVLLMILLLLFSLALVTQYSAAFDYNGRFEDQVRNFAVAFLVMWIAANIPPQSLMKVALPAYLFGTLLLVAVALFGDISKGARRWLDLGFVRIQPSEFMKIAMPLMLAWFFQQRENISNWKDFTFALVLLAVPGTLILKQPDLGTALLVLGAGVFVIFLCRAFVADHGIARCPGLGKPASGVGFNARLPAPAGAYPARPHQRPVG